jgi:hypothetical protein
MALITLAQTEWDTTTVLICAVYRSMEVHAQAARHQVLMIGCLSIPLTIIT